MTDLLAQFVGWLNAAANLLGSWLLAPVGVLPAWLSLTAVSAVTGVLLLVVFKYTSNQRAIKRARDDISANLLALKLFKESAWVAVLTQGRLLRGAARLFLRALVPTAVMALPVTLILGQLSLWYQQRPLRVGEEAVVTMKLRTDPDAPGRVVSASTVGLLGSPSGDGPLLAASALFPGRPPADLFPEISLLPSDGAEATVGPVRVFRKGEICWNVTARANGYHRLQFRVGDQTIHKELAVGDGFMRVSARRPERALSEDLFLYPGEQPFGPDSPVRSIDIDYPGRDSLTGGGESRALSWFVWSMKAAGWLGGLCGLPAWLVYWFVVSLLTAFCFRRLLRVNV
jgi:hypothetical protein